MVEGEARRIWMTSGYAFRRQPGRRDADLIVDVVVRSIVAPPVATPEDLKQPPDDARRTESGIAYRILRQGSGIRHPAADAEVTVHYSGWRTDGVLFDSSVVRGQPSVGLDFSQDFSSGFSDHFGVKEGFGLYLLKN